MPTGTALRKPVSTAVFLAIFMLPQFTLGQEFPARPSGRDDGSALANCRAEVSTLRKLNSNYEQQIRLLKARVAELESAAAPKKGTTH
jgi:hypothetical protein